MLDFICNGSVDLFGTGRERKIQNENICLQRDSNPHHASPRQESQRLRPLSHEGLMAISGLISYRIMGYTFKKYCYVTTRVNLIMVTCVFELNVKLNFHFLSHCRFLVSIIIVYRTLHWVSNHNRFHTGIVTYPFQNTVRL